MYIETLNKKLNRIDFQAFRGRNDDKIYISKSRTDAIILPGRCAVTMVYYFFYVRR